jgi:hypothetical protein
MILGAFWWGQEYTIPNRRQLNCKMRFGLSSDARYLFEFHPKRRRHEATQIACAEVFLPVAGAGGPFAGWGVVLRLTLPERSK